MDRQSTFFSKHPLMVLGLLFVVAYAAVLIMFTREGHPKMVLSGVDEHAAHLDVHLLNVDFVRMSPRLLSRRT